jgi:DNA-binding transcriptional MerR regulator
MIDEEWLELIKEAKALGLTIEDVREWISQEEDSVK